MGEKTPRLNSRGGRAPMPYFSIQNDENSKTADIYIFGDIVEERGGLSGIFAASSDQSSHNLANRIAGIPEDWEIVVHINSNGGELKEGLGIYNVLKERGVTTVCEGFAASAGSVIFAAGRRRIMQPASLLFIHQASMRADGNTDDFRKYADDLKVITDAAVAAYRECGITITDEELNEMLKRETWITPEDAVRMGFATEIEDTREEGRPETGVPVVKNDAVLSIMNMVTGKSRNPPKDVPEQIVFDFSGHEQLVRLAERTLAVFDGNPGALAKIAAAAERFCAAKHIPEAKPGNKGFFKF